MRSKGDFVLRSMTAYGHAAHHFAEGILQVEIQCNNRRYLDISISLPKDMNRFEMDIRKWIAEKIGRGGVAVRIQWKKTGEKPLTVTPNLSLAKGIKKGWEEITRALSISSKEENLVSLLTLREDLFFYEEEALDEERVTEVLKETLFEALDQVAEMKIQEGKVLGEEIERRMVEIGVKLDEIENKAPLASQKYSEKLKTRIAQLEIDDKERLWKEVALFADKVDISEEIVRFKSHLSQFLLLLRQPLKEDNESRGKTFDFFMQELMREVNTIAAKVQDADISQLVIFIKGELEKVREQLQNVE